MKFLVRLSWGKHQAKWMVNSPNFLSLFLPGPSKDMFNCRYRSASSQTGFLRRASPSFSSGVNGGQSNGQREGPQKKKKTLSTTEEDFSERLKGQPNAANFPSPAYEQANMRARVRWAVKGISLSATPQFPPLIWVGRFDFTIFKREFNDSFII